MRAILILLCNLILFHCSLGQRQFPTVEIKLKKEYTVPYRGQINYVPVKDSLIEKRFDVEILIVNNSPDNLSFWTMTCSWEDNLIINNPYIFFERPVCFSNYSQLVKVKGMETFSLKATLTRDIQWDNPSKSFIGRISDVDSTKIGLIFVDEAMAKTFIDYRKIMHDKSLWKIIWSNSLDLTK